MTEEKKETLILTKQEEDLIRILREIEFGEARIVITDGRPIRIEEIKKSIKLQKTDSVDEADWKTRGFFMTSKAYSL